MEAIPRELKDLSLDNLDFDLMTFKEYSTLIDSNLKLDKLIVKRAEELGFNPSFLTEEQRKAAVLCMPSEDLKKTKKPMQIMLKNHRLRKNLSKEHRLIVKSHAFNTKVFGDPDFIKSEEDKRKIRELFSDEIVGVTAFLYSWVMKKYDEKMFESLFDFLPEKRRLAVVDAGFMYLAKRGWLDK
jgi:hypothetical protein